MSLKIISWIGKVIATVLIVSFLSIWTTGYIITSYVESILKQYEIPIEVPPVAMSGLWGKLWGTDIEQITAVSPEDNTSHDSDGNLSEDQAPITQNDSDELQASNDIQDQEVQDVLAPVELEEDQVAMTNEEIDDKKTNMDDADSQKVLDLLMSKLPADSWQTFSTYLEDGLTDQELLEIQQIMAQYLDKAEYDELMIILKKY